jgi:flagellar biogenesis protein FliO
MRALLAGLMRRFGVAGGTPLHVAAAQPLGAGTMLYAIDVDQRRIILAISPRAICVLDRYPAPQTANPAGPEAPSVQITQEMTARNSMSDA